MNLNHLTIAKMGLDDLPEVVAISASFPLNPWSEKMFLEEMANPLSYCFVAKLGGNPIASTIGVICFRNVEGESELLHLCVHPHHRRKGIGKQLMEFYIDFCSQHGIHSFYLEVEPSNHPALNLYKLFSYQPLGVRKDFYFSKEGSASNGGGRWDGLVMVRRV